MTLSVSYMGTKRQLAPHIAEVVSSCKAGPLLDLFSGVCAVGEAIGVGRQVWCNDAQLFAATLARAFFTSRKASSCSTVMTGIAHELYSVNKARLAKRFGRLLEAEERSLRTNDSARIARYNARTPHIASNAAFNRERLRLRRKPATFPYRLFAITYAGGYCGLAQAIEIDSIRYAIDRLLELQEINEEEHRWMVLALCQALCKISTTTGHFAQFLKIKESTSARFITQRQKSVWLQWLDSLEACVPVGWSDWRANNQVFNEDAVALLRKLRRHKVTPAVIYADPPYTDDQYSRYYHLYETLIMYDYPGSSGVGRYRQNRFQSQFSLATGVIRAFEGLIQSAKACKAQLIVSYPAVGLLKNAREQLPKMLKKHYRTVDVHSVIDHMHSSLGASKGKEKYAVQELVIHAR